MSLAVSSGGVGAGAGGGGGMAVAMAHQPHAMAQRVAAGPQGASNARTSATSAPRSASGLAADVVDKNITAKQIRNSKHLPIVCMDIYGDGEIAYVAAEGMAKEVSGSFVALGTVGGSQSSLWIKRNDEIAYKALRKLLSKGEKGEGYYDRTLASSLLYDVSEPNTNTNETDEVTSIVRPQLLLGARRLIQLHSNTLSHYPHSPDDLKPISKNTSLVSAAIEQYDDTSCKTGVSIRNQSLDGSSPACGTDFDRVALQLDLLPKKKKPLTILPEEAVTLLLAKSRQLVESDIQVRFSNPKKTGAGRGGESKKTSKQKETNVEEEEEVGTEQYLNYPMAIAVPGWHATDAAVEAHLDAILGSGSEGMVYHRTVAALAGALLNRGNSKAEQNKLLMRIVAKNQANVKELEAKQKKALIDKTELSPQDLSVEDRLPLIVAMGVTADGIEGMACLVSKLQDAQFASIGKIKVLTEVSYQHADPLSQTEQVLEEIFEGAIHPILPEFNHLPCAIITFGSSSSQEKLKASIRKVLKTKETEWGTEAGGTDGNYINILSTREEAIALGACALAAGSHGRIMTREGKKVTTSVTNASTCAVGIKFMYFQGDNDDDDGNGGNGGGDDGKETKTITDDKVKVLFDFDRRVPGEPYSLEFTAAECAAIRARGQGDGLILAEDLSEDEVKAFTGAKKIPVRVEAALAFKIQVVQKCERNGKWIEVGDALTPLKLKDDENDEDTKAIEASTLELSLGASGLIMTQFYSDRKSVSEATKSARISKIQNYFLIVFAVLFVGGFLVKSYVEEKIFDRDVAKLLKYYKHVIPDSIHDGDLNHARYMVYKYRNKKKKLWKTLEVKYGIPVQDDYSDLVEEEEDVVELDDEEKEEEPDL